MPRVAIKKKDYMKKEKKAFKNLETQTGAPE